MRRLIVVTLCIPLFLVPSLAAQSQPSIRLIAEAGFLDVVDHRIAFSDDDETILYHQDGGQDVLFPVNRFSAELAVSRHTVVFLYQPLLLETRVSMPAAFTVDGEDFSGSTLNLVYSFPFYRLSYLNEIVTGPRLTVAAGASLQIRNANIEFEASGGKDDGGGIVPPEGYYRSADVGPVPLLKFRMRYDLSRRFWVGTEMDGIYAPISYLNGSDNNTAGALLDASVRAGYSAGKGVEFFVNYRYLGGGAENDDPESFTFNWINLTTVTLGTALTLR